MMHESLQEAWLGVRELEQEYRDSILREAKHKQLFLDGKPAILCGRLLKTPRVTLKDNNAQYTEFSWKAIEIKLQNYRGNNVYFFTH